MTKHYYEPWKPDNTRSAITRFQDMCDEQRRRLGSSPKHMHVMPQFYRELCKESGIDPDVAHDAPITVFGVKLLPVDAPQPTYVEDGYVNKIGTPEAKGRPNASKISSDAADKPYPYKMWHVAAPPSTPTDKRLLLL